MLANKISAGKFIKVAFFSFVFLVAFFLFGVSSVSAVIVDVFTGSPPPPGRATCSFTCDAPSTEFCWNSQAVGVTDCGTTCSGGSPWTKYQYNGCYQDPERPDRCERTWVYQEAVCSTGDKCLAGETGLRAGSCTCGNYGASVYKYCCSTQGQAQACNTNAVQDNYPPPEGQCNGGYLIGDSNASGYVSGAPCVPAVTCSTDTANPPTPITNVARPVAVPTIMLPIILFPSPAISVQMELIPIPAQMQG